MGFTRPDPGAWLTGDHKTMREEAEDSARALGCVVVYCLLVFLAVTGLLVVLL